MFTLSLGAFFLNFCLTRYERVYFGKEILLKSVTIVHD